MNIRFQNIALVGKYQSLDVGGAVLMIADFLRSCGRTVWIEQGTASAMGERTDFPVATSEEIGAQIDLVVVIGGDGTLLNIARRLADYAIPIVGVNLGHLGFLTDIALNDARERLGEILDGRFREEPRFMLEAEVFRNGERIFHTRALNDVVVNKGELGRMIEFDLAIDGEYVYTQRSDGMIISTPTGSTAYALSANGPILHPGVGGIAIVPLCPHALTARPITLPDSVRVEITLKPPHDASVHFDGQARFEGRAGDAIRVMRSSSSVRLLHPEGYRYFFMLREKLHWNWSASLANS